MTNPKKGEMKISLGEKTWNSRVTMDGLAKIEDACGTGILKVLQKLSDGDLTTSQMCNILLPIIRSGGNDVNMKDIQSSVWDAGLADAMKAVGEILSVSLGGGQDEGNLKEATV